MKLPQRYIDTALIGNMEVGESGYTVPWAMHVDEDMDCWLNAEFPIQSNTGGTVQMYVRRLEDGFAVEVPPGEKFRPGRRHGVVESPDSGWLPVVEVA